MSRRPRARPVAVLQHHADVGPGYFADWLRTHAVEYRLLRLDEGQPVPADPEDFAGICSLGGPMSANDPLPWIDPELSLLRAAVARGIPVIGHCLGGQLLARALGGRVERNPVKEIGWIELQITEPRLAREWLGEAPGAVEVFAWHGDTFVPPPGARSFLRTRWCEHQAFVFAHAGTSHIGLQFHPEITPDIVRRWTGDETWYAEVEEERLATGGPAVQDAQAMQHDLEARCAALHARAARIYARWADGLAPARRPWY